MLRCWSSRQRSCCRSRRGPGCRAYRLGQRDHVQREIELAIATTRQSVPGTIGAGNLDGCDTGVVGECRHVDESACAAGASQQPTGNDRSDAVDRGQHAALFGDRGGDLSGQSLQALVGITNVGDEVAGQLLTGGPDRPTGRTLVSSREATTAVRSVGAPPGTRSRNNDTPT